MRRGWKGEGHLFKEDPVFGDILMTPKQRCCASGGKPHFTGVPLPSAARFGVRLGEERMVYLKSPAQDLIVGLSNKEMNENVSE